MTLRLVRRLLGIGEKDREIGGLRGDLGRRRHGIVDLQEHRIRGRAGGERDLRQGEPGLGLPRAVREVAHEGLQRLGRRGIVRARLLQPFLEDQLAAQRALRLLLEKRAVLLAEVLEVMHVQPGERGIEGRDRPDARGVARRALEQRGREQVFALLEMREPGAQLDERAQRGVIGHAHRRFEILHGAREIPLRARDFRLEQPRLAGQRMGGIAAQEVVEARRGLFPAAACASAFCRDKSGRARRGAAPAFAPSGATRTSDGVVLRGVDLIEPAEDGRQPRAGGMFPDEILEHVIGGERAVKGEARIGGGKGGGDEEVLGERPGSPPAARRVLAGPGRPGLRRSRSRASA